MRRFLSSAFRAILPPRSTERSRRRGQAGQALPMFVLMIFVITGSVAVVTDVSWFWVNQQHMQRAADAGALAGAIYLPGDTVSAYTAARAATAQNGYADGVGGVVVTPLQDATNRRRLNVTVSGPVSTYFARIFGMTQIAASATSRAEFTLPVPMGSPQNYYGVGDFLKTTTTTSSATVNSDTGLHTEGAVVAGGQWSSSAGGVVTQSDASANDNRYATENTNGHAQQWTTFGLLTGATPILNDPTVAIDGVQVQLNDVFIGGSGTSTNCYLKADLTWNAGTNWSSSQNTTALTTTTTAAQTVGNAANTTAWGAHAWAYNDFSDANFRVRLTWVNGAGNGSCAGTRTVSVDQLQVKVLYHYTQVTTTTTTGTTPVLSPTGSTLSSQGFWGAIITSGGSRENGDEFSPLNDNAKSRLNPEHDTGGYDYTVIINGSGGQVQLFDPTFCATGSNGIAGGGNMGAGDHWIGGSPNAVTTVFTLYNENNTPYTIADDTQLATSGGLFASQIQADYTQGTGQPKDASGNKLTDCSSDPYHNHWWLLASGLAAGRYRINVTTQAAGNNATNAENMWSAWVSSTGGTPQVYGEGRMVAYNNLTGGTQLFYLAQIAAANAGRTMEITLFDPGDVGGNATLSILSPNGNSYNTASFTYTADNGKSSGGALVTSIVTASGGVSNFNDAVLTIDVPLPTTYGSVGLTPPGETQAGWWKIQYNVSAGNDTTTWQVAIRGSPVHLVP